MALTIYLFKFKKTLSRLLQKALTTESAEKNMSLTEENI